MTERLFGIVNGVPLIERSGEVLREYGWGKHSEGKLPSYAACTAGLWDEWKRRHEADTKQKA